MARIGINTACVQRKSNRRIGEILKFSLDHGFSGVEFKDEYPFFEEMSRMEKEEALSTIREHALFCSVHLPFADMNISSFKQGLRAAAVDTLITSLRSAAAIGAQAVTVHGGNINVLNYGEEWSSFSEELTNDSLSKLLEVGEDLGLQLSIENLHEFSSRLKRVHSRPEDLLRSRSFLKNKPGFTLDIGHAVSTPLSPVDFVRALGPEHILMSHLHDNRGKEDQHLAVGDGSIDFDAFFSAYVEEGWDFPLMIETRNIEQALLSKERLETFLHSAMARVSEKRT